MKQKLQALLLSLAALTAVNAHGETFALLVGVNDYTSLQQAGEPAMSARSWRDLRGAVNDAQSMAALLRARYRVPEENLLLLTADAGGRCGAQGCPTRANIMAGLETHLLARAAPGTQLFFYFAGHGSQISNLNSTEQDEFDESLVPMDAIAGAEDIRDKQLRNVFNRALDRGARLIVIADSCHSGSISRGSGVSLAVSRELEPLRSDLDTKDLIGSGPLPATRGAVVLSAAGAAQLALEKRMPDETMRGGFTYALVKALMSAPAGEPLSRTFQRTEVFMKGLGLLQAPQLATSEVRKAEPLLIAPQVAKGPGEGGLFVGVISVEGESATIQGGKDIGLYPGTRLEVVKNDQRLVLEVVENKGLTRSVARLQNSEPTAMASTGLASGDLAAVTDWAWYEPVQLRTWLDDHQGSAAQKALKGELQSDFARHPALVVSNELESADYELTCKDRSSPAAEVSCAWQLVQRFDAYPAAGLPVSSDWIELQPDVTAAKEKLREFALRLAKLKGWLSLASPPAQLPFPYRLELRHATNGTRVDLDEGVELGQRYQVVLASTEDDIKRAMIESRPKYVYVGGIDSAGNGYLLYPSRDPQYDHCEQLPCRTATERDFQPVYTVFEDYLVNNRETDLLYLITSDERIEPGLLDFDGVRHSETAERVMRSSGGDGLQNLLAQYAMGKTRAGSSTPLNWSIDHYLVPVLPQQESIAQ